MIIFKKKDSAGEYLQMRIDEGATWVDVTDRFVEFLQGCGYVLQGIDVAEHLMEQYAFQKQEKPDVLINGQEVSLPMKKGKRHAKKR